MEYKCRHCKITFESKPRRFTSLYCPECMNLKFEVFCIECGDKVGERNIYQYYRGVDNNVVSRCRKCRIKGDKNPNFGKAGELNPFYNRHHSIDTIKRIILNREKNGIWRDIIQTDEFKRKSARVGELNGMYGKKLLDVFIRKYGNENGNIKYLEMQSKQPRFGSGEKNPQFGKPANIMSGFGYSGWYRGMYFRSLLELSFMIKYVERFKMKCVSAEQNQFRINYVLDDKLHIGFADYIINDKYMVEIKPKSMWRWQKFINKFNAMREFCNQTKLIFKLIDPGYISDGLISELYKSSEIKIIPNKIEKFENKYIK